MPNLSSLNYSKTETTMYYTGVASGRVYSLPFDKRIWELCQSIETLHWKEIYELNKKFVEQNKK
jgi:hypothetical protein